MRKFGIIGFPLGHSFSPGYFSEKFKKEELRECEYKAYPISTIDKFKELKSKGLEGINVTIPYKEVIIPYLDALDEVAEGIGAVNTIKFFPDGKTKGYNTDVYGFAESLKRMIKGNEIARALILGTGGSSKAVAFALENMDISYSFVSRKSNYLNYEDLDKKIMANHQLIINTTPLGMAPKVDFCPQIPYDLIDSKHFCFDLVYNPEKTLFLKKAERRGANIKNGYEMLLLQAEKSWQIWNHS